jgi:hypothetical protein
MTAIVILAILDGLGDVVKEKENRIRDLLEISGMMPISYWCGNLLSLFIYTLIPV